MGANLLPEQLSEDDLVGVAGGGREGSGQSANTVSCPQCGSKRWLSAADVQHDEEHEKQPNLLICLDCHHAWWIGPVL